MGRSSCARVCVSRIDGSRICLCMVGVSDAADDTWVVRAGFAVEPGVENAALGGVCWEAWHDENGLGCGDAGHHLLQGRS